MTAHVEKLTARRWRAWCDQCKDGENTSRQVDAHIWASSHNNKEHTA